MIRRRQIEVPEQLNLELSHKSAEISKFKRTPSVHIAERHKPELPEIEIIHIEMQ